MSVYTLAQIICSRMEKGKTIVVGIDGKSASGKTTLASELASMTGCEIIHTDDFFLPPESGKTVKPSEFDGNIDYSRFNAEVVRGIASDTDFDYGIYDCCEKTIVGRRKISKNGIYVIEGTYSLNPRIKIECCLRVFCDISSEKQEQRILSRGGEAELQRFLRLWIPAENRYFGHYGIKEKCEIIIGD